MFKAHSYTGQTIHSGDQVKTSQCDCVNLLPCVTTARTLIVCVSIATTTSHVTHAPVWYWQLL